MRPFTSGLLAVILAASAVSASTQAACDEISATLSDRVWTQHSSDFRSETRSYWSTALHDAKPACLVLPRSAEEVSSAVKVLNKYPDVEFAVKSGGHSPNKRHSSVQDGVLISTRDMVGATYDDETGIAHVKPGGEWNDVIGDLEERGVAIVGGRLGLVGVGGLLLQGGISFLSSKYGLAADNIVSWELVTADGSMRTVNATEEPDLAMALRGSGSQFGIATGYNVKAYPMGKVWGGMRTYHESKAEEIFAALHNFVPKNAEDEDAAVILTELIAFGQSRFFLLFYYYGEPEPPTTGPFAQFLNIDPAIDNTKTQSYAELLKSNGGITEILHSRISFWTYTVPYVPDAPHMYQEIWNKWDSLLKEHLKNPLRFTAQCSIDFQPFPAVIGKHSQERGGNAMGLTGDDIDRVVLEIQCSWKNDKDDELFNAASRDLVRWLDVKVPEWTKGEGGLYLPYFMNDAAGEQNVTGTYKEYAKFKALQEEIDPEGFWRERGGGFVY